MKIYILILIFLATFLEIQSKHWFKDLPQDDSIEYIIRLNNGDLITGYILEFKNSSTDGESILFDTDLGKATIFESQISEMLPMQEYYKTTHRLFLMPTADGIGNSFFLGVFDLALLYMGAGYSDWLSVTAGRSMIPTIPSRDQLSHMNIKFTVLNRDVGYKDHKFSLAVGGSMSFLNHNNKFSHIYGAGTYHLSRTTINAMIFMKNGNHDFYDIFLREDLFEMYYPNGAIGIGFGLDTRFPEMHDLHFIAEIWNSNVLQPTNSAVFLGFRLANTDFSTDFGLSFFTLPFVMPYASFAWTPF